MTSMQTEIVPCPGCAAMLPHLDGPAHRYIGASPACWAIFVALFNAGDPPLAPDPFFALLGDAYAAQHPGLPSAQSIQSVAVHVLTLYGVLVQGVAPGNAQWVRTRVVRGDAAARHRRFVWLEPPSFAGTVTVAAIAGAPTPAARTEQLRRYVPDVWARWQAAHGATVAAWYALFVDADRL